MPCGHPGPPLRATAWGSAGRDGRMSVLIEQQDGRRNIDLQEHHEGDDVAGVLCPVQRASTPLVELLAASATAEPAVTLSGALAPFRNGRRAAPEAFHPSGLPRPGPIPTPGEIEQGP